MRATDFPANFIADADLTQSNTLRLPARTRALARPQQVDELVADLAWAEEQAWPIFVLGGGSNVIFHADFPGLVLQPQIRGRRVLADGLIEAAAGECWHDFVVWSLDQGQPGLENLALIPGTVGAAPIQNIGAYGVELAQRFASLQAWDRREHRLVELTREDCRFGYRDSLFKRHPDRYVVLSVRFALPRPWQAVTNYRDVAQALAAYSSNAAPSPYAVLDAVVAIRRAKLPDPAHLGNAGSFFKNPVVDAATFAALRTAYPELPAYPDCNGSAKLAAGWLIEHCGWKGKRRDGVGVHTTQALVLVHYGGATGQAVLHLAEQIRADVATRFGVTLEMEPIPVPALGQGSY